MKETRTYHPPLLPSLRTMRVMYHYVMLVSVSFPLQGLFFCHDKVATKDFFVPDSTPAYFDAAHPDLVSISPDALHKLSNDPLYRKEQAVTIQITRTDRPLVSNAGVVMVMYCHVKVTVCDDHMIVMHTSCDGHVIVMHRSCDGHVIVMHRSCDGHVMAIQVWCSPQSALV